MSKKKKNTMSVKQTLQCSFNMPEKWQEDYNGYDEDHRSLPPYAPLSVYSVDEYEACPSDWMHGSDVASSYFTGIKEDWALWLDYNECFNHTHDVVVVLSVQGINPVTGQTMVGDNPLRLEQYHKKCPIHDVDFKQNLYCEECGFEWPGQNYLSTTGTPFGRLWLDGFRSADGKIRQYIVTAEKARGVAAQKMDNPEERVYAIGMAFYLSKKKKPEAPKFEKPEEPIYNNASITNPMNFSPMHTPQNWNTGSYGIPAAYGFASPSTRGRANGVNLPDAVDDQTINCCLNPVDDLTMGASVDIESFGTEIDECTSVEEVTPVKKLEVGAGALVNQMIYDDPKAIDYWEEKPAGMIYINYCDEETFDKILKAGKRANKKDGFMQGIKVG